MRSYVVALTLLLPPVVMVSSASCADGTSGASGLGSSSDTCAAGETRQCQAASYCVGGQFCDSLGTWSVCVCEDDAGGIDVDGAFIPISSGGMGGSAGSGGASGSGSGFSGAGGVGGSSGAGGAGGTGGKGGKGGKGGSGGSGGGSGSGGASGSGGGSGSGGSSGYAYREPPKEERRATAFTSSPASETTSFVWHDAPGLLPVADLRVEAGGKPIFQVSSIGRQPFAHAGLDMVPIERDVPYRLVVLRGDDGVDVALLRDTAHPGPALLHTRVRIGDKRTADNAPAAELVVPKGRWRSSVSIQ